MEQGLLSLPQVCLLLLQKSDTVTVVTRVTTFGNEIVTLRTAESTLKLVTAEYRETQVKNGTHIAEIRIFTGDTFDTVYRRVDYTPRTDGLCDGSLADWLCDVYTGLSRNRFVFNFSEMTGRPCFTVSYKDYRFFIRYTKYTYEINGKSRQQFSAPKFIEMMRYLVSLTNY